VTVATVGRQLALKEKFTVDITPGEDDAFMLAIIVAIDACHDQRQERRRSGGGLGGIAGGFPGMGGGFAGPP
jgi:hypothetical protein